MVTRRDKTGEMYGRLLVVAYSHNINRSIYWQVRCVCCTDKIVGNNNLIAGRTRSCGCNENHLGRLTHGMSNTPAYRVWLAMLSRCRNPKSTGYKRYGGRGITVCGRWLEFELFYEDMGDPPEGLFIERINNNGNYELSNCKWATILEQANNRRNNTVLSYQGISLTSSQWARNLGISRACLWARIDRGLPKDSIFTRGKIEKHRKSRSKYRNKFGFTLYELAKKFNTNMSIISNRSDEEIVQNLQRIG